MYMHDNEIGKITELWERRTARKIWESNIVKRLMSKFNLLVEHAVTIDDSELRQRLLDVVEIFDEWSDMLEAERDDEGALSLHVASSAALIDTYNDIINNMNAYERATFDTICSNVINRMKLK